MRRKLSALTVCTGGVNRKLASLKCGVGGVNRELLAPPFAGGTITVNDIDGWVRPATGNDYAYDFLSGGVDAAYYVVFDSQCLRFNLAAFPRSAGGCYGNIFGYYSTSDLESLSGVTMSVEGAVTIGAYAPNLEIGIGGLTLNAGNYFSGSAAVDLPQNPSYAYGTPVLSFSTNGEWGNLPSTSPLYIYLSFHYNGVPIDFAV